MIGYTIFSVSYHFFNIINYNSCGKSKKVCRI